MCEQNEQSKTEERHRGDKTQFTESHRARTTTIPIHVRTVCRIPMHNTDEK